MENKRTDASLENFFLIFFILIFLYSLFEVGLVVYAYLNADKVECNWLWCTFTSGETIEVQNSYSNITSSITSTSNCFINGEPVNCSEIEKYKEKWQMLT